MRRTERSPETSISGTSENHARPINTVTYFGKSSVGEGKGERSTGNRNARKKKKKDLNHTCIRTLPRKPRTTTTTGLVPPATTFFRSKDIPLGKHTFLPSLTFTHAHWIPEKSENSRGAQEPNQHRANNRPSLSTITSKRIPIYRDETDYAATATTDHPLTLFYSRRRSRIHRRNSSIRPLEGRRRQACPGIGSTETSRQGFPYHREPRAVQRWQFLRGTGSIINIAFITAT